MLQTKVLFKGKLSEKAYGKALEAGIPEQNRAVEARIQLKRIMEVAEKGEDPYHARERVPDTGIQLIKGDEVFADVSWVIADLLDAGYHLESVSVFKKNPGKGRSSRKGRKAQPVKQPKGGFIQLVFSLEEGESIELEKPVHEFVDGLFKDTWMHLHVWDNTNTNTGRPMTINCVARSNKPAQNQLRLQKEEWELLPL